MKPTLTLLTALLLAPLAASHAANAQAAPEWFVFERGEHADDLEPR
jgi:hypothetical protein